MLGVCRQRLLERSHAATAPCAVNYQTSEGPALSPVKCPDTRRAQPTPGEHGNIPDRVKNDHPRVPTAYAFLTFLTPRRTSVLYSNRLYYYRIS